jgi:hypothetical protein
MEFTARAAPGRPPLERASLTVDLGPGLELVSTDEVSPLDGARLSSRSDPRAGTAVPSWGEVTLPAGSSVRVRATVASTAGPGRRQALVGLSGTTPAGPMQYSNGSTGGGPELESVVTLAAATTVRSTVAGRSSELTVGIPADLVGVPALPSGPFVEVDLRSRLLPVEDRAVLPQLGSVRIGVVLTPAAGGSTCATAELVDLRTGSVVPVTWAGRGGSSSLVCGTGPGRRTLELEVGPRWWTAEAVDHLGVRWHVGAEGSAAVRLEAAWLSWEWQGGTWLTPASRATGPLLESAVTAPLAAADGAGLTLSSLPRAADSGRVVDVGLPVPLATDATVESAAVVVVWRSLGPGRSCVLAQRTAGGRAVGPTLGSECRSGGGTVVQRIDVGQVGAAELRELGVRLLPSGSPEVAVVLDSVEAEVTWWRQ